MCFVFRYLVRKAMFQETTSNPLAYSAWVSSRSMSVIPQSGPRFVATTATNRDRGYLIVTFEVSRAE